MLGRHPSTVSHRWSDTELRSRSQSITKDRQFIVSDLPHQALKGPGSHLCRIMQSRGDSARLSCMRPRHPHPPSQVRYRLAHDMTSAVDWALQANYLSTPPPPQYHPPPPPPLILPSSWNVGPRLQYPGFRLRRQAVFKPSRQNLPWLFEMTHTTVDPLELVLACCQ